MEHYSTIFILFSLFTVSSAVALFQGTLPRPFQRPYGDEKATIIPVTPNYEISEDVKFRPLQRQYDYETDTMIPFAPNSDLKEEDPKFRPLRSIFKDFSLPPQGPKGKNNKNLLCFFTALPCRSIRQVPAQ